MAPTEPKKRDEHADISIHDVAKAAGVSVSTVSRVLNDKPDVAKKTRARVQRVIDEMGYTPFVQIFQPAAVNTNTIALHYPLQRQSRVEVTDIELDFILGASSAAGDERFALNLLTRDITENELLDLYRTGQVQGVILMETAFDDWRVNLLRRHDLPFVMIGRCANNDGISYIDIDLEAAVVKAFEHLVDLGHRQIGFLAFPHVLDDHQQNASELMLAGYKRVVYEYGLASLYRHVDFGLQHAYKATHEMLRENPDLTAMVMAYGATASGVIRALNDHNKSVPHDFSLIGIAVGKIAELISPIPSSVDFPLQNVGFQAAKMLIDNLSASMPHVQQLIVPPQLNLRETTRSIR